MSGMWGKNIQLAIFGESHGAAIGITISGLPSGVELDLEFIDKEMERRRPGKSPLATPRSEADAPEILSGFFNGKTTGTPLTAIIRNKDTKSKDYDQFKSIMRPGHGDYPGYVHYQGANDYRGGGHFSGRITAPLVFAGAVAKQILAREGIFIGAHIYSIGEVCDRYFDSRELDQDLFSSLQKESFPVLNQEKKEEMEAKILSCKNEADSIGGIVECAAIGLPAGLGDPFFDSVESILSGMLFSIPAVKGVEFGLGFDITKLKGSEANDPYRIVEGKVVTETNNNGGITGGISNGMPLICKVAVKATPSISKEQKTIDVEKMTNTTLKITGRHDPCIVTRIVPVLEAGIALGLLDILRGAKNGLE